MTADSVRLRGGWPPLVAAALTLATDVVYVLVIQSQGEGDLDRTRARLIAASLAAAASAALAGWLVQDARIRLALLGAAAFTMLAWGFLGMFTIGCRSSSPECSFSSRPPGPQRRFRTWRPLQSQQQRGSLPWSLPALSSRRRAETSPNG